MTTSDKQIWLPLNLVFVRTEHANLDCCDVRNNNNEADVDFMGLPQCICLPYFLQDAPLAIIRQFLVLKWGRLQAVVELSQRLYMTLIAQSRY